MSKKVDELIGNLFGVTDEDRQRWDAMKESSESSRKRADQMSKGKGGAASKAMTHGLDLAERGVLSQLNADQIDEVRRRNRAKEKASAEDDFELG